MSGASPRWPRARRDYYARLAFRLRAALAAGDLSYDGWAVLTFLVVCAEEARSGRVEFHLRELNARLRFEKSVDTLARLLDDLRAAGWIDFPERTQGMRRPYVVTLVRAAIDGEPAGLEASVSDVETESTVRLPGSTSARLPHDFRTEHLPNAEVDSATPKSETTATPLPEPVSDAPRHPQPGSPREELEKRATEPSLRSGSVAPSAHADGRGREEDDEVAPVGTCSDCEREKPLVALAEGDEPNLCERCAWKRLARRSA